MALKNKLLLYSFIIFSFCNGQTIKSNIPYTSTQILIIEKSFKTTAPNFDTTLIVNTSEVFFKTQKEIYGLESLKME